MPPPPCTFRFELADDAVFLKHLVQNLAQGEAASFLQTGMLHFLIALTFVSAPFVMVPGRLRRGRYLSPSGYGICKTTKPMRVCEADKLVTLSISSVQSIRC